MSPWVRRLLGLLLVVAAGVVGTAPGHADDRLITGVTARAERLDIALALTALPPGTRPDQATVRVLLDGTPVRATVTGAGTATAAARRTVVLLLDTSGSMSGARLRAAQQAANRLLTELPTDVRVGLVRFAGTVAVVARPTTDRTVLRTALSRLVAAGDTRLYDAVPVALAAGGAVGERRVMVLSDGRDDGSRATLAQAVAAVRRSGARVDVVDASGDGSAGPGLRPLAAASGGRAVTVSAAGLATAFSEVARSYLARLTVRVDVPPALRGKDVQVSVTVSSATGPRSQQRTVAVPGGRTAPVAVAVTHAHGLEFWLMLLAVFLACLLLLAVAVTTGDSRAGDRRRTHQALSSYTLGGQQQVVADPTRLGSSQLTQSAVGLADRAVARRGSADRLALALDRAGLRWRPGEWLVIWAVSTLVGTVLVPVLLGGTLVNVVLGATGGWFAPRTYLHRKGEARRKAFLDALPDALQLLSAGLATGYSLAQALDAVVEEGSQPMAGEIGRALAEARIGQPLEDALDGVAERMDCEDFRWVVMAVRVQREVGGNLSEVLTRVCLTMRDRAALRRQVRALSAEGRVSAYVLIALPLSMAAFMFSFRRDYFRPIYTEPVGLVMLGVTAVALVLGMLWMKKLVKVEM